MLDALADDPPERVIGMTSLIGLMGFVGMHAVFFGACMMMCMGV